MSFSNTSDVIDSRDIIARFEELQEDCIQYVAGWNFTGCLAEGEPQGFTDFGDAKGYILKALQYQADSIESGGEDEEKAEDIEAFIQDINLESGEFSVFVKPLNLWYWVKDSNEKFPEDEDDAEEYEALKSLIEECEGYGDWAHGEILINEDYFTQYVMDMLQDIGVFPDGIPHYVVIDEEATADNFKEDYMSVDFDGQTFYMRS